MIERLRKRFIRIAVLSVALVMLLLSVAVNVSNFVSVNSDVDSLLAMISEEIERPAGNMRGEDGFHGGMHDEGMRPDG